MALPKLYEQIVWHNNTTPAINEDNLNSMSQAIEDIDDRVIEIASTVMEDVPALEEALEEVETLTANPPYIGENGNWWVWDTSTGAYVDSGVDASITITVGTTTTLSPGSSATVTNVGTATDPIFNFGIPKGDPGESSGGGHTIENASGTDLTQRDTLQFALGFNTTDDSTHEKTVVSPDAMQSADMADVITPLPSARSPYHKYSTTEQVVGEWIDGKPIYEKTITFTNTSVVETDGQGIMFNQTIFDEGYVDTLIDVDVTVFANSIFKCNGIYDMLQSNVIFEYRAYINLRKTALSLSNNRVAWNNADIIAIIRYTKTTD